MNDKRFNFKDTIDDEVFLKKRICDDYTNKSYDGTLKDQEDLCELLNELNDENDVLKQQAENRYIYVLEAYAYSDFEKHILAHQAYMSDKMFFNFVKKAQKLCETTNYIPDKPYKDYAANMIACLCKVFGFEEFDYPSVHIGVSPKSKCFMWTENGAYEK